MSFTMSGTPSMMESKYLASAAVGLHPVFLSSPPSEHTNTSPSWHGELAIDVTKNNDSNSGESMALLGLGGMG